MNITKEDLAYLEGKQKRIDKKFDMGTPRIELNFPFRAISKDNEKLRNRQGLVFTSKKFKDFEKNIKLFAQRQYKGEPLTGDLWVELNFHFKNKVHCDCQNLPKGVCDALQGIAYINDKQIKRCMVDVSEDGVDCFNVVVRKL